MTTVIFRGRKKKQKKKAQQAPYASPHQKRKAQPRVSVVASRDFSGLSPRELEILELVARGYTNREIGDKLILAEETIKSHVKHIFRKLGAVNRAHAVWIGVFGGWLQMPSQEELKSLSDDSIRALESA